MVLHPSVCSYLREKGLGMKWQSGYFKSTASFIGGHGELETVAKIKSEFIIIGTFLIPSWSLTVCIIESWLHVSQTEVWYRQNTSNYFLRHSNEGEWLWKPSSRLVPGPRKLRSWTPSALRALQKLPFWNVLYLNLAAHWKPLGNAPRYITHFYLCPTESYLWCPILK